VIRRRAGLLLTTVGIVLATVSCGDDEPAAGEPQIPAGYERVTGSERVGWMQQASSAEELATFRYLVYVDDRSAVQFQGASCETPATAQGFACRAQLPSMSPGAHSLRLSAFIESGGQRFESPRSSALNVFFVAVTNAVTSQPPAMPAALSTAFTTADGVELRAETIADGLSEPTDLAFAPDGALFVTERAGHVRVFRAGRLRPVVGLTLPDVWSERGGGLLAIALHPEFARNGYAFLAYTADTGFRIARFRVVSDTLGERAILLDALPRSAVEAAASLRFDPGGRLFAAFDDGDDPRAAGDFGSFSGKLLRLNTDVTRPGDGAGQSPIVAAELHAPRGAAWNEPGTTVWLLDSGSDGAGQIRAIAMSGDTPSDARVRWLASYVLPDDAVGAGLAFYRHDRVAALRGSLLVAADGGIGQASLLRLVFDSGDAHTVIGTERWLRGSIDGARAIGVSPDGVIHLLTRTSLVALAPGSAR
jgi:glucose/arabinose dehydrogenase